MPLLSDLRNSAAVPAPQRQCQRKPLQISTERARCFAGATSSTSPTTRSSRQFNRSIERYRDSRADAHRPVGRLSPLPRPSWAATRQSRPLMGRRTSGQGRPSRSSALVVAALTQSLNTVLLPPGFHTTLQSLCNQVTRYAASTGLCAPRFSTDGALTAMTRPTAHAPRLSSFTSKRA
jgi:hypothetical protein